MITTEFIEQQTLVTEIGFYKTISLKLCCWLAVGKAECELFLNLFTSARSAQKPGVISTVNITCKIDKIKV